MKLSSLLPKTRRSLLLATAQFSVLVVGSALVGQYGFDLYPCELCLYQRYPYFAIILVGLYGSIFARSPKLLAALLVFVALMFLTTSGIGAYHTGVEYGWFQGPSACSSGDSSNMTLEEMRAQIMNAPLVSCAQAMAYIFGLSMAAWNAMLGFAAALGTLWLMRKTA
ncbi:MAG: disulfide bond formation protein B [Rickettsiales bacterium]|jgi:disulfide bond formation protein DsbB|nr:disulfide bond formation protein B [Rickettsiales bacterium]